MRACPSPRPGGRSSAPGCPRTPGGWRSCGLSRRTSSRRIWCGGSGRDPVHSGHRRRELPHLHRAMSATPLPCPSTTSSTAPRRASSATRYLRVGRLHPAAGGGLLRIPACPRGGGASPDHRAGGGGQALRAGLYQPLRPLPLPDAGCAGGGGFLRAGPGDPLLLPAGSGSECGRREAEHRAAAGCHGAVPEAHGPLPRLLRPGGLLPPAGPGTCFIWSVPAWKAPDRCWTSVCGR